MCVCTLHGPHDIRLQLEPFAALDLAETIQASMFRQADSLRCFMCRYRSLFPRASGCFIWQYNEPWPTLTHSIVDYYGRTKMAYYALKRANAPAILMIEDDDITIPGGRYEGRALFVADGPAEDLTASIRIMDMKGTIYFDGVYPLDGMAGTNELASFACDCSGAAGGMLLLELRLTGADGMTVWADEQLRGAPDFKRAFQLPACDLDVDARLQEDGRIVASLVNKGEWAALNIRLDLQGKDPKEQVWLDNFRSIAPGCAMEISVDYAGEAPAALALSGWNLHERTVNINR